MIVVLIPARDAPDIPCNTRSTMSMVKLVANAQLTPKIPKRNRQVTSRRLRPTLSAMMPPNGPKKKQGRVYAVKSNPTDCSLIPNAEIILGKAGTIGAAIIITMRLPLMEIW